MKAKSALYIFLLLSLRGAANPFLIDFPVKTEITQDDYIEIQKKLKAIDINSAFNEMYPATPPKKFFKPWSHAIATKDDFYRRISKALSQTLIDPEKGKFPVKELVKIGNGGPNCIVSYASLNGKYASLIADLPGELEELGFNGYLLYRVGGFPNPTGKEIRYCGVPYSFKIFSIVEAHKMGFDKVLWIDSAFFPLRDPTPLFEWIEKKGCFIKAHHSMTKFVLPKTVDYLKTVTKVNVLKVPHVTAQIIGFDFKHPKTEEFIEKYYELVDLGLPFFSCFPEEFVFSAITARNPADWPAQPFTNVSISELKLKRIEDCRKDGYFFLQKDH